MLDPILLDSGLAKMDDGARIYWETSGNRHGVPALYLHGGPGSGLRGGYCDRFDPVKYHLVAIDQRGCGRSMPNVGESASALPSNTTGRLIADIETIRDLLSIDSWVIHGVSWGSTLGLAYAQAHPERVRAVVLLAATTTSRAEVAWITEGVGRFFPAEWATFEAGARRLPGERLIDAYARRLANPDPSCADDRMAAAGAWDAWESTHVSLDPGWQPGPHVPGSNDRLTFATLVTHYWSHAGFLTGDRAILANMHRIATIPGVIVHGSNDVGSPVSTARALADAWPSCRLQIASGEGHVGPQGLALVTRALCDLEV